jgi:hypothetical protein
MPRRKYTYATLHDAWIGAWWLNAMGDATQTLTPYQCHTTKKYYYERRRFGNLNPWAWAPAWVTLTRLRRINKDCYRPCRLYQLTSTTCHILPRQASDV